MEQQTIDMLVNALSSMGGAMGGKGSWQEAAGNFAKSRMQSRNYAAMLQKILGGMPSGAELKAAAGANGKTTITMPTASIQNNQDLPGFSSDVGNMNPFIEQQPQSVGGVVSPTPAPTSAPATTPTSGGGFVNPSMSPLNINAGANLEGLTPENITEALQLGQGQQHIGIAGEELGIRKADLAMRQESQPLERLLIAAQIRHATAQSTKLEAGEPLDQLYPVPVPGIGAVTQRQWEHIPEKDRAYSLYAYQAKILGFASDKIMSRSQWDDFTPTEHTRLLKQLQIDPQLMATELKLREASKTDINLGVEKKKEMNKLEGESYFVDPKNLTNDLAKHLNTEEVKNKIDDAEMSSRNRDKKLRAAENKAAGSIARFSEHAGFIENQIKAGGGEIVNTKYSSDYRTLIWTVKWPSGTTSTIKRDVPGLKEYLESKKK